MEAKINEIIQSLEAQFNGDTEHDIEIIRSYIRTLEKSEESQAIVIALGRYSAEKFPDAEVVKNAKKIEEAFKTFHEKVQKAQECLKNKDFEGAAAIFREIIAEVKPPKDEEKRYMAFSHPFEEMLTRASTPDDKRPIERISVLPATLYYQLGLALFELKNYDEAKVAFDDAIALNPVSVVPYFELIQIAKIQNDFAEVRRLLSKIHPYIYTRHHLARFYREHAGLAMIEKNYELAIALVYISIDYEDAPPARAQLNALAKNRGVDLSKPKADTIKERLKAAEIPVGPNAAVYELAIGIGNTLKKTSPMAAKMAYAIAYDLTHYKPLLKELQ
jgi:tetratricopeptide (TPR) repeat protein